MANSPVRSQTFQLIWIIVIILTGVVVAAQRVRPLSWRYSSSMTLQGVSEILNSMPLDRALEAKIFHQPERREGMTVVQPYYVFYRD